MRGVALLVRKSVLLLLLFVFFTLPVRALDVSAKAAVLLDVSSGRVLYEKNENQQLPMASTTKIMTGLLAVESGKLNEVVTVPGDAIRVAGTSMGLVADEKITLRDLTYGLLLESGNDAANVIATYLGGGSVDAFVKKMNEKAESLGLSGTHFITPSGLDSAGHYTTALDLARLAAAALKNSDFAKIVSTYKIRVTYNGVKNGRLLVNHNRLLRSYPGAAGVKTGFTKKSGRCLVSCAQRGDVRLVACTLKDPRDWKDHAALLDMGFATYHTSVVLEGALRFSQPVVGGRRGSVQAVGPPRVSTLLKEGEADCLRMKVHLPRFVYAPVQKGQTLGSLVFYAGNEEVANVPLTAARSVRISNYEHKKSKSPGGLFGWLFGGIFKKEQ